MVDGDMIYTLVIILCSHLSYAFINSGRIYIKVEECFCDKEKVKNGLQICFFSIITPMKKKQIKNYAQKYKEKITLRH